MKRLFKLILVLFAFVLCLFLIKEIYSRCIGIRKVAISEEDIKNKDHIICREHLTTGFKWVMLKDENGQNYEPFKYVVLKGEILEDVPSFLSSAKEEMKIYLYFI